VRFKPLVDTFVIPAHGRVMIVGRRGKKQGGFGLGSTETSIKIGKIVDMLDDIPAKHNITLELQTLQLRTDLTVVAYQKIIHGNSQVDAYLLSRNFHVFPNIRIHKTAAADHLPQQENSAHPAPVIHNG